MIAAKNLTKTYGAGELTITVLDDVTIEIPDGEFISITGPSGAGKSTLLYQLSLLDEPTSGDVYVDGKRMSQCSEREKASFRLHNLGYVFQDYALLPELTALENVALPMLMQGEPRTRAYKKAKEALTRIGLSDKAENRPSQLSGGQQQRVSIARSIAHHPKILFADEPMANLDSENANRVMDAFLDLHKEGQTIVMVTHEEEFARQARRMISLRDGHIVEH